MGIQRLKILEAILIDYTALTMELRWKGQHVTLQGITDRKVKMEAISSN